MKKHLPLLALICMASFACTPPPAPALLQGKIENFRGEGNLIAMIDMHDGERRTDTIAIQPDGTFEYSASFSKPATIMLIPDFLGNDITIINVYMVDGSKTTITVTSAMNEVGRLVTTTEYSGDNKVESEFLQLYFQKIMMMGLDVGLEKAASFAEFEEFRTHVKELFQPLRNSLELSKDEAFKATNTEKLDDDEVSVLFRFAWARYTNNQPVDADADFVAFANSIDMNDPANLAKTETAIRWQLARDPENNESFPVRLLKFIKEKISNQEVINALAQNTMDNVLATGGSSELSIIFTLYVEASTDTEAVEKVAVIYNQLMKLSKGAPAPDFEMQDMDGNAVRFSDVVGQGKVVYIDFWATWCGPCRMEEPHFKALIEKYKRNANIEFIAISLDDNIERWLTYLEVGKPTGRQYIIPDNFNSAFAKEYNIQAIPRFMAFDKEGRIIDISAPRPSNPEVEAFLNTYLK
jgi:thiol-disulfide isomerase/thioredoxin